jgi:hypothetical protein
MFSTTSRPRSASRVSAERTGTPSTMSAWTTAETPPSNASSASMRRSAPAGLSAVASALTTAGVPGKSERSQRTG